MTLLILGAGYTGSRVAVRWKGEVIPVRRAQVDVTQPGAVSRLASLVPPECVVLHSIPSLPNGADAELLKALEGKARHVVYLSTTGVYGAATHVDETTPVSPRNAREQARVDTELAVMQGPWTSLVLRPAAIYGPGRGVHVSMAEGRYTLLGDGSNYISRIHVDDLAALAAAGLRQELTGAFPVADLHPCPAREVAEYCARAYGWPMPVSATAEEVPTSRRNNRQVDGRAICARLGVTFQYPSYREGIPSSRER
ncbi:MAG: NAD-dependent epimerase/dehydratase family protein [Bryobacteraceae bacterium]|nr:NAD-dependent epimerase/dehydratase family protein [Bryobacteraceae bacterium]